MSQPASDPVSESIPHPALPSSARISADGVLCIGGVRTTDLARRFGTPLYIYDTATIDAAAKTLVETLGSRGRVHYAGKAYLAPWLLRRLIGLGMDLDACSHGELAVALRAGFPAERIRLHGNNKTDHALRLAVDERIGAIIVDNIGELHRLVAQSASSGMKARIVLRLNPAISAHTHEYLQTGNTNSKFGLPIVGGVAEEAVCFALNHPERLTLLGYHAHIGTQVLDLQPFADLMSILLRFSTEMRDAYGYWPEQLSPGGGPGITYTDERTLPIASWLNAMLGALPRNDAPTPMLHVEPGRSLIGPAGVALYRVGGTKHTSGGRDYVLIDGGMADNIRPALYQAEYTALPADKMFDRPCGPISVAGPFCESGDILIREASLPPLNPGDLLAVPAVGAYCLAMSSNYNGALRPAVVTVENGEARLVQRRQTLDDLLLLDMPIGD
jgi:diaminopimelate decarboxylase